MHVKLSEFDDALLSIEEAIKIHRQFGEAWALKANLLADNALYQEDALRAADTQWL